jgi:hypothetical protein
MFRNEFLEPCPIVGFPGFKVLLPFELETMVTDTLIVESDPGKGPRQNALHAGFHDHQGFL